MEEDEDGDNDDMGCDDPGDDWLAVDEAGCDARPDEDIMEMAQGMVMGFQLRSAESLFECSLLLP